MRLLRTDGSNLIVEFQAEPIPPYVILSHTWGRFEDEVTLQDMTNDPQGTNNKSGFTKIIQCCARAREDQFEFAWVDTCCIDKTSSAELSEAINSMYRWYQRAGICYVYLVDVPTASSVVPSSSDPEFDRDGCFRQSRWFTRGWTLQELIAPGIVEFYAADWTEIGTKHSLAQELSATTGISRRVLEGFTLLTRYNVAERMSWAAKRTTTRPEDAAYSLLGIFGVNMPLLYGEGKRAFLRLQEEILKNHADYTLLAWNITWPGMDDNGCMVRGVDSSLHQAAADLRGKTARRRISARGLFASDPSAFNLANASVRYSELESDNKHIEAAPPALIGGSLQASLLLWQFDSTTYLAYLFCKFRGRIICIGLTKNNESTPVYYRGWPSGGAYYFLPADNLSRFHLKLVYVASEDLRQMLSHITEDAFSDPSCIQVNGPGLEYYCGWDPSVDKSSTNKVPDFQQFPQIIRCVYKSLEPFIIIAKRRGCEVMCCNDPHLVSLVGDLFSNRTWNAENLQRAKKHFSRFRPNTESNYIEKDRVVRHFSSFTLHVAYKALGGTMTRQIRLKLLDDVYTPQS